MARSSTIFTAISFLVLLSVSDGRQSLSLSPAPQSFNLNRPNIKAQENAPEKLHIKSLSPDEIESYLKENIEIDLRGLWSLLRIKQDTEFPQRCGNRYGLCKTEKIVVEESGDDVFLKLTIADASRYLLFRRIEKYPVFTEDKWKFVGYVDSLYQQYAPPEQRIIEGDNRTYLVVRELWGRGTGVGLYGERWYELSENPPKEVLSYPVEGHDVQGRAFDRMFESKVGQRMINGSYVVEVQFSIFYGAEKKSAIFSKKQKACYVRDSEAEKLGLSKTCSNVSEEELEAVYNFDSMDEEGVLEYNFGELERIAMYGKPEQKEWLENYLSRIGDSPKRAALQKLLARKAAYR
jgi:hypothetical protein